MKCPCCNKDMGIGVVQSAREIFFTENPHTFWFKHDRNMEVLLSSHNFMSPTCLAYICRDCGKVVIDYTEKFK